MPVWATIALPLIAFVWVACLVGRFILDLHDRRRRAESFMEWMHQDRENDHA